MAQSGRAPAWGAGGRRFESDHPDQKIKRAVSALIETSVDSSFVLNSGVDLSEVLTSFIYSSAHKSPKTIKTLYETLTAFIDYLRRQEIDYYLGITRQHVEGFIWEISQGRKGKPLSVSNRCLEWKLIYRISPINLKAQIFPSILLGSIRLR